MRLPHHPRYPTTGQEREMLDHRFPPSQLHPHTDLLRKPTSSLDEWTPGEDNEWRGACRLDFWRTQTQDKTTATMVYRPCLIHHERPPSRAGAAARGATNLISGLSVTFCGGAAVVGGSGAECGRFVVASVTIYTVKGRILEIPHQSTGGVFWRLHCASYA